MFDEHHKNTLDKRMFMKGAITGIAVVAVLGGVFLAGKNYGGGSGSRSTGSTVSTGSPQPSAPIPNQPQGPSGDIQIAAVTDKDWVRGNKKAKLAVIEFSDLECPFCKRFHPTMQQLLKEFPNDVKWVYRHFPLTSLHPKAPKEAEATECAGDLGGNDGFWKYTDRLFEITPSNNGLDAAQLPQIAQDVGLNRAKFEECLNSGKYAQKVQDHYNQAIAAQGTGTPYSVILTQDGQKIPVQGAVPYEQLKSAVQSAL